MRKRGGPVLRLPSQARELAAWELFRAIEELFPTRFEELRSILNDLIDERPQLQDPDWDEFEEDHRWAEQELTRRVDAWIEANRVSSPAVGDVAEKIAGGQRYPNLGFVLDQDGDKAICARPFTETLSEFVVRARAHYREVQALHKSEGAVVDGPSTRKREHFRYLVAHIIGGYSFASIAAGKTPFRFLSKSAATIAGEARKAAASVGITLPRRPGPRRGSRAPRRGHIVR